MLKIPPRKKNAGQNVVEYSLLITLVIGGIIIMRPYVIGSWNANLKGWEDSVEDSFNDPLQWTNETGLRPDECTCAYISVCPHPPCCGMGGCGPQQSSQIYTCYPQGCESQPPQCTNDPGCCEPTAQGECGVNEVGNPQLPSGCPDGQRAIGYSCGGEGAPSQWGCTPALTCVFTFGREFL